MQKEADESRERYERENAEMAKFEEEYAPY
jgi:hypothetical protein